MSTMAIAYHAASDEQVWIFGVQDGTATVAVFKFESDGVEHFTDLHEVAYADLSDVCVNGAVIDTFEAAVKGIGQRVAEDALEYFTGTRAWMLDVLIAWSACYK